MESVAQETSQLKRLSEPLYRVKGWIKFAGVMTIISGAFQVISIWGILIAWLPIWMGVLLISASNFIGKAYESDAEHDMLTSMGKLGTYFKIFGIFMVVLLVVMIIGVLAAIMIPAYLGMQEAAMSG